MSYDENTVLDIKEKVSKNVVNISTMKLVHNIFCQAVPVGGTGSGTFIDKRRLNTYHLQNLTGQPIQPSFQVSELIGLSGSNMFVCKSKFHALRAIVLG